MGCKVFSILGMPYVLPCYVDKRGPQVTFLAVYCLPGCENRLLEVTGTKVMFGLVLHRRLNLHPEQQPASRHASWVISEPTTGCRIVAGCTRQHALDHLAAYVAFIGGEEAFSQAVKLKVQSFAIAAAASPPVAITGLIWRNR